MKKTKILSVLIMTVLCAMLLSGQAFAASENVSADGAEEETATVTYSTVTNGLYEWIDEYIDAEALGLDDPATPENEGIATIWLVVSILAAVVGLLILILGFNSWKILLRVIFFFSGFVGGFAGYSMLFTHLLNTTGDANLVGLCRFFLGAPVIQCVVAILCALICFLLTRVLFRAVLFGGAVAACVFITPLFVELPLPVLVVIGAVLGYFVAFPLAKPLFVLLAAVLAGSLVSFAVIELFLFSAVAAFNEPIGTLDASEAEYLNLLFLLIAAAAALLVLLVRIIVAIVSCIRRRRRNRLIMNAALEDACGMREIRDALPFLQPLPLSGAALKARIREQRINNRERERALDAADADAWRRKEEEKEMKKLRELVDMAEQKHEMKRKDEAVETCSVDDGESAPEKTSEPSLETTPCAEPTAPTEDGFPSEEAVTETEPSDAEKVVEEVTEEAAEEVAEEAAEEVAEEVVEEVAEEVADNCAIPVQDAAFEETILNIEEAPVAEEPKPIHVKEVKRDVNAPKKLKVSKDCSDCSKCGLRPYCKSPKSKVCKPSHCATCVARKICPKPLA